GSEMCIRDRSAARVPTRPEVRLRAEMVDTAEMVMAYGRLIRAGQPAIIDDSPPRDVVYAAERKSGGVLHLMLAGNGPTIELIAYPGRQSAKLVGYGWGEQQHIDDTDGLFQAFADHYRRKGGDA
ncbi:hypothetical protein ACFV6Y_39285, partial [Streptomyces massasporeus]|uniref:hypothetical protein n=1 Tax=Streptomyces massasporeus TaxID=67324 RepID=UPI00365AE06F